MQDRTRYLFKNIGILTISNFASKFLVFFLVPLYTSALTKSEYGTYDIVYSSIQLAFPLLTLNISDATMRFAMDKEKDIRKVSAIGCRFVLRSLVPIAVFFIGCKLWKLVPSLDGYELLVFLYVTFYFLNQFLIQLAKGWEKVSDMGIAAVLSTVVLLSSNIALLLLLHQGLRGFYLANVLGQMIPTIYLTIKLKIWKLPLYEGFDPALKKEMLGYCIPLILTVLGWWINNAADKYTVAFMLGADFNGLLSVAYKIPSILNTVQNIIIQAWQISAIKEFESQDRKTFYGRTFINVNLLMSLICAIIIAFTKPVARIMFSNDFYEAWIFVPFLLIASVFNSASGLLGPILAAKKDSKAMALSAFYGAIVNIILNILFVYLWGVQGAAIATLIASYVIFLVRKKALAHDINIAQYYVVITTWILLIVQACLEIYSTLVWDKYLIMLIIVLINYKGLGNMITSFRSLVLGRGKV